MGIAHKVERGPTRESVWTYDWTARAMLAQAIAQIDGLAEQAHADDRAYIKELADDLWAAFRMARKDDARH